MTKRLYAVDVDDPNTDWVKSWLIPATPTEIDEAAGVTELRQAARDLLSIERIVRANLSETDSITCYGFTSVVMQFEAALSDKTATKGG
jgi:hypothetical protein